MRRLLGLLLIIRAFSPVIGIGIILWGASQMAGDVQDTLAPPVKQLEAEFADLGTVVENAQQAFQAAAQNVTSLVNRLRAYQVPNLLPNLPTALSFPGFSIPNATFPLPSSVNVTWKNITFDVQQITPRNCGILDFACKALGDIVSTITKSVRYPSGVTVGTTNYTLVFPAVPPFSVPTPSFFRNMADGLESVFSGFKDIFSVFDPALGSIKKLGERLQGLPDSLTPLVSEGRELLKGLADTAAAWGTPLGIGLIIIAALVIIACGVTLFDNLARGVQMLFGAAPALNPQNRSGGTGNDH